MRRFVFALGLLATVAVAAADGGYILVRIVLADSAGAGGLDSPSGIGTSGPGSMYGGRPIGPGYPPGGSGPMGGMRQPGTPGGPGPGPGGPGRVGPMPMGSNGPMNGAPAGAAHDPTQSVVVVVPYTNTIGAKNVPFYPTNDKGEKLAVHIYGNPAWELAVKHPHGYTNLLYDNTQIQVYTDLGPDVPRGRKSRQTEVTDKHDKFKRNPTEPQLLLDLITEALGVGLVTDALAWSDDLVALAGAKDKKAATTPQVDRFVAAYSQVAKALKSPAPAPSDGPLWKDRWMTNAFPPPLPNYQTSKHYYLIYWDASDVERTRRVNQLEENFQAFFLLHALQGVALKVPDRPLVAVLPRSGKDVVDLARALDGTPRVSDAFYAPDHGVLVLAPERLDANGQSFQKQMHAFYRSGWSKKDLLIGKGPPVHITPEQYKDRKSPDEVARVMTWVMVERYLEDEAELAGVSREGSRQLLHATGQLPQHVVLPQWLAEGSASYYERPKGPVFFTQGDDHKAFVTVALATGYGGPNYVRQKQFTQELRSKQLPDGGQLLRNVVTDAYFQAVRAGLDADDPRLPLPPNPPKDAAAAPPPEDPEVVRRRRFQFLTEKANATSWSLYYYLAKNHRGGLERYCAELGKLPRDLPIDEQTRLTVFAQAFNLTTASTKTDDRQTFSEFAGGWLQTIQAVPPAGIDVPLNDLSPPMGADGTGTGTTPMPNSPKTTGP